MFGLPDFEGFFKLYASIIPCFYLGQPSSTAATSIWVVIQAPLSHQWLQTGGCCELSSPPSGCR